MLNTNDVIIVDTKDIWVEKALDYALRSFYLTFNRMGTASPYRRIKNIAKGLIAEFAVEYFLKHNKLNVRRRGRTPWYAIDRYDLDVGKIKIDIKSNFIDLGNKSLTLSNDLRLDVLNCKALVPADQLNSKSLGPNDVYIFPFLSGYLREFKNYNPSESLLRPNIDGRKIVHAFWDYEWWKPKKWEEEKYAGNAPQLGQIYIKSDNNNDKGFKFKLIGTSARRKFEQETIELNESCEALSEKSFFQLFAIVSEGDRIPSGKLFIYAKKVPNLIEKIMPRGGFVINKNKTIQNDWDDTWIYDSKTFIAGFITKARFKRISKLVPRFTKEKLFETKTENKGVKAKRLSSIMEFIALNK
ncbi:MAG: hypothetical protein QXL94_03885 [Candidatus Parvarchaeum sp.]